jgi:hypothetical protein
MTWLLLVPFVFAAIGVIMALAAPLDGEGER